MSLYLAIVGTALGLLLLGAGAGGYYERRRAERETGEPSGRHAVGIAAGSSTQQGRVLGGDITEEFNALTTAGFTADELERIRSTT